MWFREGRGQTTRCPSRTVFTGLHFFTDVCLGGDCSCLLVFRCFGVRSCPSVRYPSLSIRVLGLVLSLLRRCCCSLTFPVGPVPFSSPSLLCFRSPRRPLRSSPLGRPCCLLSPGLFVFLIAFTYVACSCCVRGSIFAPRHDLHLACAAIPRFAARSASLSVVTKTVHFVHFPFTTPR